MNATWAMLLSLAVLITACSPGDSRAGNQDWPVYGGNKAGNRYSSLDQINTGNVKQLAIAWRYFAAEPSDTTAAGRKQAREIQCQPIVVDGVLYGTSPNLKLFALKAKTGEEIWKFDPGKAHKKIKYTSNRGVVYWRDEMNERIFYTVGSWLYAIDAQKGQPVNEFGDSGRVSLYEGLSEGLDHDVTQLSVSATSPGVVYKDVFIIGSSVSETGDAAPGHVRAFDARTGKLRWVFHTIPHPGEPGYETWPEGAYKKMGGANNWSGMVVDEKRGVVYFGTGSPSEDFYGGGRKGLNLFSDCIIALDALSGKLKWYYQTVHHDLWDLDLPCPPNLATLTRHGQQIDALVQTTKNGQVFVLDRDSGKPLFPVEERAVPLESLPGEAPWPTQPLPVKPAPFSRQLLQEADLSNISPSTSAYLKKQFSGTNSGHAFLPPSKAGSVSFSLSGGAEWGGNAVDPSGVLYQNANNVPIFLSMISRQERDAQIASASSPGKALFVRHCALCHGTEMQGSGSGVPSLQNAGKKFQSSELLDILNAGRGRMPSFTQLTPGEKKDLVSFLSNPAKKGDTNNSTAAAAISTSSHSNEFPHVPDYLQGDRYPFVDERGYPGIKPPWGTFSAIDLNTGDYRWQVTLGEFSELSQKGIPPTGTPNHGGPLVTAGGLAFIAATEDEKFRAFDKATGKLVWEFNLPASAFATPISYEVEGRQYIAIAAGGVRSGRKTGGWYLAFSLPAKK